MPDSSQIIHSSKHNKDLVVEYSGVFSQEILSSIWSIAKEHFEDRSEKSNGSKKQLLTLVELSQNIAFHSLGQKGSMSITSLDEDVVRIEVQNEVSLEQMELLSCHLELLKNSSKKKLKEMFSRKIQEKMKKNTAGLGLIEIFKFSDQISYDFIENKNSYTYLFKVTL